MADNFISCFVIYVTYFVSAGNAFVFSVDEVFSYNVVERRGIIPLVPTVVRLVFDVSYFVEVLGFAGLLSAVIDSRMVGIVHWISK